MANKWEWEVRLNKLVPHIFCCLLLLLTDRSIQLSHFASSLMNDRKSEEPSRTDTYPHLFIPEAVLGSSEWGIESVVALISVKPEDKSQYNCHDNLPINLLHSYKQNTKVRTFA
jgi:hypothetical protein